MTEQTKTKEFDAVKMMRDMRDKISRDILDLSFEEQRAYYHEHASEVRNRLRPRQERKPL